MEKQRGPARRRLFVWPFAAWTAFIFLRSLQPAELSGQESGWILSLLLKLFPFPWLTDHIVRKAAHFTEFAVLGLLSVPLGLACGSLSAGGQSRASLSTGGQSRASMSAGACDDKDSRSTKGRSQDCAGPEDGGSAHPASTALFSRRTAVWLALSLCGLTALCDETIQLFSEGRSGQVSDVWLDIGGAAFGIALSLLLRCITARRAGRNRR